MKIYLPSDNPITQGYSSTHPAYDFSGLNRPDEVRCGKNGVILERVDLYDASWINTGKLTTKDYGNYIKIKHEDGTFALYAHLRKGSSFIEGTEVKAGQVVARIGNTGNSTGPHLHCEFRSADNINVQAEFYKTIEAPQLTPVITDQTIIDLNPYGQHEVQALRGKMGDLARLEMENESLKTEIDVLDERIVKLEENIRVVMLANDTLTKQARKLQEDYEGQLAQNKDLARQLNECGRELLKWQQGSYKTPKADDSQLPPDKTNDIPPIISQFLRWVRSKLGL